MDAIIQAKPLTDAPRASDLPSGERYDYWIHNGSENPGKFNPFEPDPIGALREAYAFISQPLTSSVDVVDGEKVHRSTYDTSRYNDLTTMLRLAIRRGERGVVAETERM